MVAEDIRSQAVRVQDNMHIQKQIIKQLEEKLGFKDHVTLIELTDMTRHIEQL